METLNTKKVLKNYVHPDIFLERWEADDMTPMSEKEYDEEGYDEDENELDDYGTY